MFKQNKLTPEEERVIVGKGTEAPFSGEYDNFFEKGIYVCKRCGQKLFDSKDKFDAGCGWPSFDDDLATIEKVAMMHGMWSEIQCRKCGAHLGHVFEGEELTDKNTRHCVNSISLKFIPDKK